MVHDLWTKAMHKRYPDWMNVARDWVVAQAYPGDQQWDGEDFSRIRLHRSIWIPDRFWLQMIDYVWDTEAWKRKSRINRANRNTQFEGVSSRHTGGSISTAQHRDRMAKVMGREPTAAKLFERTHCTNQKFDQGSSDPPTDPPQFSYPKATRYHERFQSLRCEAQFSTDNPPPDEASLWEQSVGGRRKGRIFVFGTTQDSSYAMTCRCSSSESSYESRAEVAELREKLARVEEEAQLWEERYLA
ncbi:uncharacterized protein LOC112500008 [Cynara cardunculus var. scolymus]|uniref:uncharacterized protein LOC112500008 n=1 Tax=Cynara cardunculus var. scolymus TaxID=59895 RepID=UPI000D62BCC4|nr:uncharacterized protein LOC112500008 [Cynara cardunculus var. scolymus]